MRSSEDTAFSKDCLAKVSYDADVFVKIKKPSVKQERLQKSRSIFQHKTTIYWMYASKHLILANMPFLILSVDLQWVVLENWLGLLPTEMKKYSVCWFEPLPKY